MKKKKVYRLLSFVLAMAMLMGLFPAGVITVNAADTASVTLTSLGQQGTVKFGSKTKSGTWWQMNLNGKKAFCLDLGYTCHNGNTYAVVESKKWDQDTNGEKSKYYARIVRWYVVDKKRSKKGFVMSQALIWSVANGRTSKSELKDVIKQVQNNISISPSKSVDDLYKDIFEPDGDWTAEVTYWEKTGNNASYQTLLTVDAEDIPQNYTPKTINESVAYRQRITIRKQDEEGNGLSGIQFTLSANNLDDLYSFSMTDRDGTDSESADENDTGFTMTGYTNDSGNIAYRMTYKMFTMDYYYYPEDQLKEMSADDKKEAKKYLTDDLDLDEGVDFASDLTKESAQALLNAELEALRGAISNTYILTEDNTGSHTDLILDPAFAQGVQITLTKDNSWEKNADDKWPDSLEADPSGYSLAYITGITNHKKKASVQVVKIDQYSSDKKPHGEADLEGAQFTLCADEACTTAATVYDANGNAFPAGTYTVQGGKFSTDYLKNGVTYYLKEITAPTGYTLANDIIPVTVDTGNATAEYTSDIATIEFGNQPVLGKVAVQKYYSDGESGTLDAEANTTFQVYLTSKGSYDACDDYERATIKTDTNGYGITGDLYYGTYTVHQVDSGDVDAIAVKDFNVEVTEAGKTYTYPLNNKLFKTYLRILKKDGNTEKQVLKAGTTYQIYQVTAEGEELVEQSYANGNKMETVSQFVTDETGEIMTVKALKSGTYRIYEVDSATGLHATEKYIEVTINSKADNYEGYIDEDGNSHAVITLIYTNKETVGKLKIYKTGEMLTGYENGKFVFENRYLKGAVFEVYASEDIVTQDNQGTNWYDKDELVATITTGEGAEFTKECTDITGYRVDENGVVEATLPLGKYHVKETAAPYGYVLTDKEWDVDFTWENMEEEFVVNSTNESDELGVINVENALAKTQVSLHKKDDKDEKPIQGATFGLYTKNDIYNVFGEKIVDSDTQIASLVTDGAGNAVTNLQLPLMSEAKTADETASDKSGTDRPESAGSDQPDIQDIKEDGETSEISGVDDAYRSSEAADVSNENNDGLSEDKTGTASTGDTEVLSDGENGATSTESANGLSEDKTETASADDKDKNTETSSGEKMDSDENTDKSAKEKSTDPAQSKLLNTGDYYLKELSVSGSYYMRDTVYPIHLEYKDQNTKVIATSIEAVNTHTETTVSKMDITGSAEVPGCDLEIKDKEGNVIIKWTSGVQGTIVLSEQLGTLGYRNVAAYLDEKGNMQVSGLFHDVTYTLTETRPADGYVTSGDILFQLVEGENGQTLVATFEGEEMKLRQDHTVLMCDDTTKIKLLKLASDTGEGLAKAKFEVYDSEKNKVLAFETSDEGYDVTGILAVGKTYTFKEIEAPKGYKIAKSVEYTVQDTPEIQQIVVKDEKKPKPKVPQTGGVTPFVISIVLSVIILISGLWYYFRKRERR
ncbi:MAG: hypothetical protein IJ801_04460 [Lachnospiraceae bacterium]|nr:hypothetical protein [Lachnospiraceae bacterium]